MSSKQFEVIEGGVGQQERLLQRLLSEPQSFEMTDFENLVENVFSSRLTYADIESMIAKRVRMNVKDALERDVILAIMNDDKSEASRLHDTIKRRNQLGLRVIYS